MWKRRSHITFFFVISPTAHTRTATRARCGDARPTRIARPPSIDELRLCGARLVSSRGVAPSSRRRAHPTRCGVLLLSRGYPNIYNFDDLRAGEITR